MNTDEYFSEWLSDQKLDLAKSTYESWTIYVNKHLIPWFRKNANDLSAVCARDIKDYIKYKRTSGRLDGQSGGLSAVSVKKHLSIIRQCLDSAVVDGYLTSNPAKSVHQRRQKSPVSERTVMLDPVQANNMLEAFKGHWLFPVVAITLFYGLRRSEVLGLQWSSVDFINNEIRIEHTVVKNLTIEEKDTTKTLGSCASFGMLPNIRTLLLDLYEKRNKKSKYVFCREDGTFLLPDTVTRAFKNHLKKCHLPQMRFHDLRHSTASILLYSGWDLEKIKIWLRHADIETTSNIYLHFGRGTKKIISDMAKNVMSFDLSEPSQNP